MKEMFMFRRSYYTESWKIKKQGDKTETEVTEESREGGTQSKYEGIL